MQSSTLNAQGPGSYQPPPGLPPGPPSQAAVPSAVPSILVQPPPPPSSGVPSFPVPQLPHLPATASGASTQAPGTPGTSGPQRHPTHPIPPTSPPTTHTLRPVQSAPGLSSSRSSLSDRPLTTLEEYRQALDYQEGEIPVLEKYDSSWATVTFSGELATSKSNSGPWWDICGDGITWTDGFGVLSDSHFLVLGKEPETAKSRVIIRPIPLECLRLVPSSFNDQAENRKQPQGFFKGIMCCCRSLPSEAMYPFTVYHAAAKITRRHTLYTRSPTERNRWRTKLDEAIAARKSKLDVKTLYVTQILNDGFFRIPPRIQFTRGTHYTGQVVSAAGFSSQGENYIAVGCTTGIYVSKRAADYSFQRVLEFNEPTAIVAIPAFDKFLVHCESSLFSYSLDMVVRVAKGEATTKDLDNLFESLAEGQTVSFLKTHRIAGRTLVIYAANSSLFIRELTRQGGNPQAAAEYQLLRSIPISDVPHDAVFFLDKIAICADKAVYIVEPLNTANPSAQMVPDLPNTKRDEKTLKVVPKVKIKGDMPKILDLMGKTSILGIALYEREKDILLVYEDFGCFVDQVGKPARSRYYIEWERRATTYARRGPHLLLLSPGYIEVRNIDSGKLAQIVEVNDMRLLRSGLSEPGVLLAAMIGGTENDGGRTEKLVELLYNAN